MKQKLLGTLWALGATVAFIGCGDRDLGRPVDDADTSGQTVVTNIQEGGSVETAPGAGSAVGGDPAGAGTAPLRDETPPPPGN